MAETLSGLALVGAIIAFIVVLFALINYSEEKDVHSAVLLGTCIILMFGLLFFSLYTGNIAEKGKAQKASQETVAPSE